MQGDGKRTEDENGEDEEQDREEGQVRTLFSLMMVVVTMMMIGVK